MRHFVGRGLHGKAMYVGDRQGDRRADVRPGHGGVGASTRRAAERSSTRLPELERVGVGAQIEFMETTDMAVVVSQSQNEIADMRGRGPRHPPAPRADERGGPRRAKFKDPDDPFRLVFVCAMWMTGFDVPSCSTIYLDRPMKNHTLMQTIARANRVFPEKDNGLIVDYVGVFRNLESALAVYGAYAGR